LKEVPHKGHISIKIIQKPEQLLTEAQI